MEHAIGVVLDTGSSTTKAGFANEAFPRASFPTVVASFRNSSLIDGIPSIYCGKEAISKRGISTLSHPVEKGFITNWSDMEKLWHHIFYKEIMVPPEETRIMHAVHPLVSERDKERISEILFESFTVRGIYLMKSPVLALHSSGRTTGIVWEGGYSCSYVAPVFEGFPLRHATILSPMNGQMVTDKLQSFLAETGYSCTTALERDLLNTMKEKSCYIAREYDVELNAVSPKMSYVLPDGQQILLGDERFKCAEVLFNPAMENLTCPGLTDLLISSINKCDIDYRTTFFENIVLAGGTSMFPGLVDRLQTDLTNLLRNQKLSANIDAAPSRQYAAWTGGSIIASMDSLKGFWLTKAEYEDGGPERVRVKCCEVFFETLNSPGLCIQPQGVLALYGSGFTTGMSVDLGYDTTDICPCYEGGLIKYAHMQTNLAAKQVAAYVKEKLAEKNLDFGLQTIQVIQDIIREIYVLKEFVCVKNKKPKYYTLPSGEMINIDEEAFIAGEALFQPKLVCGEKCDFMPLASTVVTSALKCDPDLRIDIYNAVVPWGGLAVPGIVERLQKEIEAITMKPACVITSLEPYTVSWLGGSTFAGITEARKIWITKKQFEEYGAKIVSNKLL